MRTYFKTVDFPYIIYRFSTTSRVAETTIKGRGMISCTQNKPWKTYTRNKDNYQQKQEHKRNNPWGTISLHWTWPYECPGGGVLWGWHRCVGHRGNRQQDQLEKALNWSGWFFPWVMGPWASTASLKEPEAASQSPMPRSWGTKVWDGHGSMAQRSCNNQHKLC